MAVTSPDNIVTPDDGDGYDLVQDLAAMADSVQDALTGVRDEYNPYTNDSGWVTVSSLSSSFTARPGYPVQYRKVGKTVYLRGELYRTSAPAFFTEAFSLPAGFRPIAGFQSLLLVLASGADNAYAALNTSGSVQVGCPTPRTSGTGYQVASIPPFLVD